MIPLQRFIGDITKFFGIDLNSTGISSKLQPTVGVSFGLPNQNQQYYGGQPQNYLGTGTGVNPYPGATSSGLSVGALDINPLVSFQATTNDDGEIVNKPLINLHVTPNGCGIFGCEDEFDPSYFFGTRRQQAQSSQRRPVHFEQLTPSPIYHQENSYKQKQNYNVPNYPKFHQQTQSQQHHQPRPQYNQPQYPQPEYRPPQYNQPQYPQSQ